MFPLLYPAAQLPRGIWEGVSWWLKVLPTDGLGSESEAHLPEQRTSFPEIVWVRRRFGRPPQRSRYPEMGRTEGSQAWVGLVTLRPHRMTCCKRPDSVARWCRCGCTVRAGSGEMGKQAERMDRWKEHQERTLKSR